MNPATQQVKRAVRLIVMRDLLSERPLTVADMVERFGVAERTVYRDLQELQAEPLRFPLCCEQMWASMEVMAKLEQLGALLPAGG